MDIFNFGVFSGDESKHQWRWVSVVQWSSFRGAVPPIQRTRGVAGHHVSLLCTVRRGLAAFLALCIKHFGQPLAPPVVGQPSEGEHVREAVIVSDSQIVGQLPAYTVDQRLK